MCDLQMKQNIVKTNSSLQKNFWFLNIWDLDLWGSSLEEGDLSLRPKKIYFFAHL